jgi:hypothetical protein
MPYYEDDDYDDDEEERYERRRPVRRLRRPPPRYEDEDWEPRHRKRPVRHSGLGIASFILGGVAGFLILVLFMIAGVMENNDPGIFDEAPPQVVALVVLILGCLALNLGGLVLGLIGVFQRRRSKVFPGIGIGVNAFVLLGAVGLMCIGALAGD